MFNEACLGRCGGRCCWRGRSGARRLSLGRHGVSIGQDSYRDLQRGIPEEGQERIEVQSFDVDQANTMLAEVAAHARGECVDHHEFGCALDEDDPLGEEELGARDVEVALKLLALSFVEVYASRKEGLDLGASVDEAHQAV